MDTIYQGYFLTTVEQVRHVHDYKEVTSYQKVDVYDKEGQLSGKTKDVPIYTQKQEEWFTKRPALGEDSRDWQLVAAYDGKVIVYIVTNDKAFVLRLEQRAEYLGNSISEICSKAETSFLHKAVARHLLYSSWHTGVLDEDKNEIVKRGNMADWIAAAKPKLLTPWFPKLVYAGVNCSVPDFTTDEGKELFGQLTK